MTKLCGWNMTYGTTKRPNVEGKCLPTFLLANPIYVRNVTCFYKIQEMLRMFCASLEYNIKTLKQKYIYVKR